MSLLVRPRISARSDWLTWCTLFLILLSLIMTLRRRYLTVWKLLVARMVPMLNRLVKIMTLIRKARLASSYPRSLVPKMKVLMAVLKRRRRGKWVNVRCVTIRCRRFGRTTRNLVIISGPLRTRWRCKLPFKRLRGMVPKLTCPFLTLALSSCVNIVCSM